MGIATILSLVGPLIPGLVSGVEGLIKGNKQGTVKKNAVVDALMPLLNAALAALGGSTAAPVRDDIAAAVESIFHVMNSLPDSMKKVNLGEALVGQTFNAQVTITGSATVK